MKLSIIVCTTGKRKELADCLASLQKVPSTVEVIVVENPRSLSQARNEGAKKAKGEYVAFIDDDSIASPTWIQSILTFIKKHPEISAFGGPYTRHTMVPIPNWMPIDFSQMSWGGEARPLDVGNQWLTGTNMIFKKSTLHTIGGFDESLGMKGSVIHYGEEIDAQIKLAQLGESIWYVPNIKVSHLMHERKMHFNWACKDSFIRGIVSEKLKQSYPSFFKTKSPAVVEPNQVKHTFTQSCVKLVLWVFFGFGVLKQRCLHEKI